MFATRRPTLLCSLLLTPLALALGGLSATASAQSLKDMVDQARASDPSLQAVRAQADAAQRKADQAGALWMPSVGLSAGVNRTESDTPYASTRSADTTSKQVAVQAQQSLYNPANNATVSQAQRGVNLAQAQLRAAEQDLIVRVAQAYFDVLGSQDALATVQASKKAIAEQLASAKRNFEVGTANITDAREAEARFDLSTAQELAADNDLRVKRLALEQLVGRTGLTPHALAKPVALPPLLPAQVDEWLSSAEAGNTSIEQAKVALDVAKLETEKARAGHLPIVALTGSYARSHISTSGDSFVSSLGSTVPYSAAGNGSTTSIGVTVTVPLFTGFATQNRIRETLSLEDKARYDLEGARNAVAQGTRAAFFGVQSGAAQIKALEAAEGSSKLALEAIQLGYKVGVRVNVDVLNAQTQLFQTQRDLSKARYDVIVGRLKLRQAAGQLGADDLDRINALLSKP